LAQAQRAKYARILNELKATTSQHILEIGCGFGGFAEMAVENGQQVYGITLSAKQWEMATQRVNPEQAQFEVRDYRDIEGQFDHIVSIEMFEAVGRQYWDTYFAKIKSCLARDGKAVIQTITIDDELFDDYVNDTDFIQQFIFPGGLLPSINEFKKAAQANGLQIINEHAFGLDYAETLRRWRKVFHQEKTGVLHLGFDEKFIRTWDFYLAYCEAGFETRSTDVVQFTLSHA
jgi:cyclopropane-fatty-acyl-phospholipid synthase